MLIYPDAVNTQLTVEFRGLKTLGFGQIEWACKKKSSKVCT